MRSKHKTLKKWISGLVVVCLAGFLGACQEISVGQLKIMEAHGENETQTADKEKDVAQQEPDQEEKAKPEDAVFSYLQGTKSYEKEKEWSGAWCYEEQAGSSSASLAVVCAVWQMYTVPSAVTNAHRCRCMNMHRRYLLTIRTAVWGRLAGMPCGKPCKRWEWNVRWEENPHLMRSFSSLQRTADVCWYSSAVTVMIHFGRICRDIM